MLAVSWAPQSQPAMATAHGWASHPLALPDALQSTAHLWPTSTTQGVMERSTAAKSPSSHAHCGVPGTKWCSVDMTCGRGELEQWWWWWWCSNNGVSRHTCCTKGVLPYHHTHASCLRSVATPALPAPHPGPPHASPTGPHPPQNARFRGQRSTRADRGDCWGWAWGSALRTAPRTRRPSRWCGRGCHGWGPAHRAHGCQCTPGGERAGAGG